MTIHIENEHFSLPRDPEKALLETAQKIQRVMDVYVRETDALEKSDIKKFMSLQEEKLTVAKLYESAIGQILRRSEDMRSVRAEVKTMLRNLQDEFLVLARRNLEALERIKNSTNRLSKLIMSEAQKAAASSQSVNYTPRGEMSPRKSGLSIGVSQSA
jgi:acyl-CoA synthetase (NDP forming)